MLSETGFIGGSRIKTVVELIPIRSNREGRLRTPPTQVAYAPGSEPALFLGRGYTEHEHLPWFGLVNMNFASKREQYQTCLSIAEHEQNAQSELTPVV